jgi:hypothetical protein
VEEKKMNVKAIAATLGLASLVLAPAAMADQWNKRTKITINEPIQVPGKVLQPGTYVMRLATDSYVNRHIIHIFNEREDQLQTTILAIPNYRLHGVGKTEFQWWETPAGQPKALRAWFYPTDNFGHEFAYPKNEAMSIAAATSQNVPTTYAEKEAELATARVGTVDRAGTEMELDRQTYTRADGAQKNDTGNQQAADIPVAPRPHTELAQNTATSQDTQAVTDQGAATQGNMDMERGTRSRSLPRTASPVPMASLAGLLALGASLAVRSLNRK